MSSYTLPQIAKALTAGVVSTIGAAATAAGGADISTLTLGQWAIAIGAGLAAFGGVFRIPNAATPPTASTAPADVTRAIEAIQASDNLATAAAQRANELKGALASAVTGLAGDVFEQVLKSAGR